MNELWKTGTFSNTGVIILATLTDFCCVWLIHYIFSYVLNTSAWQILNLKINWFVSITDIVLFSVRSELNFLYSILINISLQTVKEPIQFIDFPHWTASGLTCYIWSTEILSTVIYVPNNSCVNMSTICPWEFSISHLHLGAWRKCHCIEVLFFFKLGWVIKVENENKWLAFLYCVSIK